MGKCQSCGAEGVVTQYVQVGRTGLEVCGRCYAEIEKNKAEKEHYERNKIAW